MSEARILLFSEEKRSKKDFIPWHARQVPQHACQQTKVFWFFFSKKNRFLPYAKVGRLSAQGFAASNAALACSTPRSSNRRPTICSPTGSPAGVNPHGTLAAGLPDQLNG
jgi:hypothetical protein